MKRLLFLMLIAFSCGLGTAAAQDIGPEWGENDSQEVRRGRRREMNYLNLSVGQENWGLAGYYLQKLMKEVPKSDMFLYQAGIRMYKKRADEATDPAVRKVMADSLLLMHDELIKNFGEKNPASAAGAWNNRAVYTQEYFGDDRARVLDAYRQAVDNAVKQQPSLAPAYFVELTREYSNGTVDADKYLAEYDRLAGMLKEVGADDQLKLMEGAFANSGAADCDGLERMFGAQIDADPSNVELLDKAMALLNNAKCTGDFYIKVAEALYKMKPSSMTALIISKYYKDKGDAATASRYSHEAMDLATDPADKAKLMLSVAADDLTSNNFRSAYSNAQQAASVVQNNATANYIMGVALAGGAAHACGDAFTQRTVYWLAYDKMVEARRLAAADPASISPELMKDIENNVARYRAVFPSVEELFLQTLKDGQPYNVSCGWITGRTTVRGKQ